jgi:DNA-binding MarR family transcriptional regulator
MKGNRAMLLQYTWRGSLEEFAKGPMTMPEICIRLGIHYRAAAQRIKTLRSYDLIVDVRGEADRGPRWAITDAGHAMLAQLKGAGQ